MSIRSAHTLGGRYQLHARLGRGETASVWAGVDTRLDRPIAVKVVDATTDAEAVRRLDQEARTVARLAHPNIVAVYDIGTEAGVPYLVMEFVEGEDLRHRLARGPLTMNEAVGVAAQVCAALMAAHDAGVVHRDVKPDNILLTTAGTVKVCDFGIAGLRDAAGGRHSTTATGTTATGTTATGTSEFMAPEQAAGRPADERSDLYALGCVLYAMLAGAPPFTGPDEQRVRWQQVHEAPVPIRSRQPDLPQDLTGLVDRLLAKSPADRPAGAGEVGAALAALADAATPVAVGSIVAAAPASAHARVPVATPPAVTRTRTMPAIAPDGAAPPSPRGGIRLGLASVAAVAVGVAAVTAVVVALVMSAGSTPDAGADAAAGASGQAVASTPQGVPPDGSSVDALRGVIAALVAADLLGADAAESLIDRLDEVGRAIARGQENRAADRLEQARDRLDDLRRDGRVDDPAYTTLATSLDQLADAMPRDDDNNDRGGGNSGPG